MNRFASTVGAALWWVWCVGHCTLAAANGFSSPPSATELAAAQASVRTLLNPPGGRSPEATYAALELRTGPAVHAFYDRHAYATRWIQEDGWNTQAHQALELLRRAADVGLNPQRYAWKPLQGLPDSLLLARRSSRGQLLAVAELRLTDALLQYLQHIQRGSVQPGTTQLRVLADSAQILTVIDQLHTALLSENLSAALLQHQPASRSYRLLQTAWVRALHASPTDSVKLMQDTVAGFRRVALNLERLRWQVPADSEYVLVNIPAYRLQVLRNGRVVRTHRVIVGKPEFPTPVLSSRISVFVVAPEWRVPYSIAVREFLPELQRDPGYLSDHHYRLYDWRGRTRNPWRINWQQVSPTQFPYTIRQQAGYFNALGSVVFYFPNQQIVFLHDTPGRSAFNLPERALSHGCVRVEKPLQLAEYLLRREGRTAELTSMYQGVRTHQKQRFDLQRSLPIYLGYYTCETDNGKLVFLPDIYQSDQALARTLFSTR